MGYQWLVLEARLTLFLSWRIDDSNARIRISTIEVKANTQQVLAVSALTGKPLRLHRPSRVTSCLSDWVPDSMVDPWIKFSRLSSLPSPKQQTVLLGEREVSYGFFVNISFFVSSSVLFNWILFLWGICNTTRNGFRYRCSKKCVCRILFCNYQEK